MPDDMRILAGLYNMGYDRRIYQIEPRSVELIEGAGRRGYVHDLSQVRTLAPIRPRKILNAAGTITATWESGTPESSGRKRKSAARTGHGLPVLEASELGHRQR
jgi:hypothetical protein